MAIITKGDVEAPPATALPSLRGVGDRVGLVLVALGFLGLAILYVSWPVRLTDTDIFYHLAGGRQLFATGAIPDTSYFSFIEPVKHWNNYYWLFQAVVWGGYDTMGWFGLCLVRGLLATTSMLLVYLLFTTTDDRLSRNTVLAALVILGFTPRFLVVRPHLVSYFCIVIFIFILERRGKLLWLLPLVMLLWVNLHGVEYPVMLLLLGAYLVEGFMAGWFNYHRERVLPAWARWLIIGTMYLVLATPHGLSIFPHSLETITMRVKHYISEMLPMKLSQLMTIPGYPFTLITNGARNSYAIFAAVAALGTIYKGRPRISHLILFLGGVFLLTRANRFIYEYALLSLPLVIHAPSLIRIQVVDSEKLKLLAARTFFLFVPVLLVVGPMSNPPLRPYSKTNLPEGPVIFLNSLQAVGKVLSDPDFGGYLEFRLDPRYKIFMDMQMGVFTDSDYIEVRQALHDGYAFERFKAKYHPGFILADGHNEELRGILEKHPEYVEVFFDDIHILFMDKTKYPDLAEKYALKCVSGYEVEEFDPTGLDPEQAAVCETELKRLVGPDYYSVLPAMALANLYISQDRLDEAEVVAEGLVREFPEMNAGYALKGQVYLARNEYAKAADWFERAEGKNVRYDRKTLLNNLYLAYVGMKRYQDAWEAMFERTDPFFGKPDALYLFELGVVSLNAGRRDDAVFYLTAAAQVVAEGDKLQPNITRLLDSLQGPQDRKEESGEQ